MTKSSDVHHGEMVSLYLKNKLPLPRWAEYRIFPRSGSTAPYWCMFVPRYNAAMDQTPSEALNLSSEYWHWAQAQHGRVWCFMRQSNAESFLEFCKKLLETNDGQNYNCGL